MEWLRQYPGLASMVPTIRAYVRAMLADRAPVSTVDDVETITAEPTAVALRYSVLAAPGGRLLATVTARPGWTRVTIGDGGPDPAAAGDGGYGRGLESVNALAARIGHAVTGVWHETWAELTWTPRGCGSISPKERSCGARPLPPRGG